MDIKEEMEMRHKFLHRLYELRREKPGEYPSGYDIGKELGFSPKQSTTVMDSLDEAGKIEIKGSDYAVDILQPGREQVEEDLLKSTETEDKKMVYESEKTDPKKVYIVHGRNEKARRAMFDFLRSIGLDPIEWNQAIKSTRKATPFIGEVLDRAFEDARAVIVLITGDDVAKLKDRYIKPDDPDYEKKFTPQARPNVLFEAGLAFGRCSDRAILVILEKETTRPFSDIYGRHLVKLSNKPESRMSIIDRLKTAGCAVDIEGKEDWMHTGDFEEVINFTNLAQEESPEQRKLEFTDEQLFVLALIVESEEEASERLLSDSFREQFPDAYGVEFKSIISWLERNELIRFTGSIGGHTLWVAIDKGIEHAKKELKRIKNYKKQIDEFKEKSIIANDF